MLPPVPFSFETHQRRKRPQTPPPQVNLSLLAGSALSSAAPCPGWPVSPLYLNDVAVTPHWGQRVGSGPVGKIPASSKHWSGGQQLPCTRGCIQPRCSGHEEKSFLQCWRGTPGLCSHSQGPQCPQSTLRSPPAAASAPFCWMKAFQAQTCWSKCVAVPLVPI